MDWWEEVLMDYYKQSPWTDPDRWVSQVKAYHITPQENAPSILATGLQARVCSATSYGERRPAVYLLACRSDAYDPAIRMALFGRLDGLAVIEVTIPRSGYAPMCRDDIFAASVTCSDGTWPTAIQYLADIPADWCREI